MARPKLPAGEGKRVPLNMRTTLELRALLDEAADASGRSLAQEVETRLEKSFNPQPPTVDEALYGSDLAVLGRVVAYTARIVQLVTGKSWKEDPATRARIYAAAQTILLATLGDGVHPLASDDTEEDGRRDAYWAIHLLRSSSATKANFPEFSMIGESDEVLNARLQQATPLMDGLFGGLKKGR